MQQVPPAANSFFAFFNEEIKQPPQSAATEDAYTALSLASFNVYDVVSAISIMTTVFLLLSGRLQRYVSTAFYFFVASMVAYSLVAVVVSFDRSPVPGFFKQNFTVTGYIDIQIAILRFIKQFVNAIFSLGK